MAQCGALVCYSLGTGSGSFSSESETFLQPVSCALTADVDGGLELKGEHSSHSSLRFWPEESVQFHNHEMKDELNVAGQRGGRKLSSSVFLRWRVRSSDAVDEVGALLRRGQVVILMSLTVLFPSPYVWSLHSLVSSASLLLCMVMTVHVTHMIHRIHAVCACGVLNLETSMGDWAVRGRGVCVPGETKALSASTRCGVRPSGVNEFAHSQQTPRKLHEETVAGL